MSIGYFIGYSLDSNIRFQSSSGGIGTSVIKHLLFLEDYGTVLSFRFNKEACAYEPYLAYGFNEYNNCGSIYQDINIVSFIKNHLKSIKRGIIITCLPCQVLPLRKLLNDNQIHNFIISFSCSGQITVEGTKKIYDFLNIDHGKVTNIRYRGNGWPSGINITLEDGSSVFKANYTEPWSLIHQSKLFTPKRCLFCTRDTGRDADLALADPWLKEYIENDSIGSSMVLSISERGHVILCELEKNKEITLTPITYNEYAIAQKSNILKSQRLYLQKRYLKILLRLFRHTVYTNWATKSINNLKRHISIISIIGRFTNKTLNMSYFSIITEKIIRKIRYRKVRNKLLFSGGFINMGHGIHMNNPHCVQIGKNVGIGNNTFFGPVTEYCGIPYNPRIIIGDNCSIGKNNSFAAIDRVEIGKNVLFAGYVHITDHSHGYEDIGQPIQKQYLISKGPVIIEDDCWLGFNCEILSGVHVGKHSIIAARAVVTHDVPPYSIVAGNPARVVKQYDFNSQTWQKVKK